VSLEKGETVATIVAAITVMVATVAVAVAMTALGEIECVVNSRSTNCE